jgi:hypothetical protein
MAATTKSFRVAHGLLSCISPLARLRERRRRNPDRISSSLANAVAA